MTTVFFGLLWGTGELSSYFRFAFENRDSASGMIPLLTFTSSPRFAIYFFAALVIGVVYEGALLRWRSQTVGKMVMGIRVVDRDGHPVSAGQAWIRGSVRSGAGVFGIIAYIDYLAALFGADKATLHDRIAATRVVRE